MVEYNVIACATKYNPVCVLTVVMDDGTVDLLEVKDWMKENGLPLIGIRISVETTNREILPSDIKMPLTYTESSQDETAPIETPPVG